MSISVGVSSTAKKIKRVYVGVDGVAKPVSAIYCGDSQGAAKVVYKDDNSKVDVVRVVKADQLVCVHRNANEGDVYITTVNVQPVLTQYKYTESKELSKLSNAIGLTESPSNLNPNANAMAFKNICFGTKTRRVCDSSDDFVFSFSMSGNLINYGGETYVRRINPVEMTELSATANGPILTVSLPPAKATGYPVVTSVDSYYIPTSDAFSKYTPPRFHLIASDRGYVAVFNGTETIEGAALDSVPISRTALTYVGAKYEVSPSNVTKALEYATIWTDPQTFGKYWSLAYTVVNTSGDSSIVYKPIERDTGFSNLDYSVGAACHTFAWLQDGTQGQAYAVTINYTFYDGRKYTRHSMLLMDTTLVSSEGLMPEEFSVHKYEESANIHEDGLVSKENYGWFILGSDSSYLYVLSTLADTYKVLAFEKDFHDGGGFHKAYEFDTGYKISSDKTLAKITPVAYNGSTGDEQEKSSFTLMPSFMLIGEEKVGATQTQVGYVFVIPRHIICSDANKVQ